MMRTVLSFGLPVALTGMVVFLSFKLFPAPSVHWAVSVGFIVALIQSTLSVGLMKLTWEKKTFYWAWGGGFFFRLVIFAATAFVVHKFTDLSLVWTLVSLALATMIFLVIESSLLFWKKTKK